MVLVIDDDAFVRETITDILEYEGIPLITAVSGEAGVDIYRKQMEKIDLILLDMSMPGMSGDEVYHRLKATFPDIRVLISSGSEADNRINKMLEDRNIGYIKKPYSIQDLSDNIYRIIHGENTTL